MEKERKNNILGNVLLLNILSQVWEERCPAKTKSMLHTIMDKNLGKHTSIGMCLAEEETYEMGNKNLRSPTDLLSPFLSNTQIFKPSQEELRDL